MNEETFTDFLTGLFLKRPDVFTGIGDDAAALDLGLHNGMLQLIAADQVLQNVHFVKNTPPESVAKKLLRRNISDIAAMGGIPSHAVVTVSLNPLDEIWMRRFHQALAKDAEYFNVSVVGGDISQAPEPGIQASLTILGMVERDKICLRKNAKAGDCLYVTGKFGKSFPSQHHLHFMPRISEGRFLAGTYTRAMMDVSDGLTKDLSRFAFDSGVSVRIDHPELIPARDNATLEERLNDGEDYELIVAVPAEKAASLEANWHFETELTAIGKFEQGNAGQLTIAGFKYEGKGYDHFSKKSNN